VTLLDVARGRGLPTATDDELYGYLERRTHNVPVFLDKIDLVISFLFWKRIRKPLIELPRVACINFHPGPLPEARGFGPYSWALYNQLPFYGVTAHHVDENLDTGDIVKIRKFQ